MEKYCLSALPRLVLATSILAAIAAAPGSVAAQSRHQITVGDAVVTVSYADLDLSTGKGAETLATRITNAAAQVCEENDDSLPHNPGEGNTACRRAAVARAVANLHAPLVNEALGISPSPEAVAKR